LSGAYRHITKRGVINAGTDKLPKSGSDRNEPGRTQKNGTLADMRDVSMLTVVQNIGGLDVLLSDHARNDLGERQGGQQNNSMRRKGISRTGSGTEQVER
jgi:hypothetical protein